jgi:hypothetical protein
MEEHHNHSVQQLRFKDFVPLIIIYSIVFIFVGVKQVLYGYDLMRAMRDFMGAFFIIFGGFKLINIHAFVEAYSTYDIIAQKSRLYGYVYPFLEIMLGILYLNNLYLRYVAIFTIILMTVSAIGVAKALMSKESIMCACLGVVFKVPMTYVTLFEDIVMIIMAFGMLFII